MCELTKNEIMDGLGELGVQSREVMLVHSAMRTMGRVKGGASTVVDAMLEILTPSGTLLTPTFTFAHEADDNPVIDPAVDRSEMEILTETVRQHPQARRSTAFRHSFAAIGRRATVITDIDTSLSAFDLRSSFGVMLALNTQVLLMGVTYSSSTSHHFAEFISDVPYRQTLPLTVRVRASDGTIHELPMTDYQPKSEGRTSIDWGKYWKIVDQLKPPSSVMLPSVAFPCGIGSILHRLKWRKTTTSSERRMVISKRLLNWRLDVPCSAQNLLMVPDARIVSSGVYRIQINLLCLGNFR